MRQLALAAGVFSLVACSGSAPVASVSPSSRPSASPSPAPMSCRLPVAVDRGLSGFITYPGGAFTPDPSSDLTHSALPAPNAAFFTGFGPTYDAAFARWLPVARQLVSPDGATYAYTELVYPPAPATPINGPGQGPTGSRVHLVDVATGTNHVVLDSKNLWATMGDAGSEIYLEHPCFEGCGAESGGLWSLDASTGSMRQIAAPDAPVQFDPSQAQIQHLWMLVGADAAWGTDPQGRLARLDLATGTASVWLTVPGKSLRPIGIDLSGHPIVEGEADYSVTGTSRGGAWLVRSPEHAEQIAPDSLMIGDALSDAHGTWLLSLNDLYLRTGGPALNLVASLPAATSIGGPCAG